jgi:hypothetical protein
MAPKNIIALLLFSGLLIQCESNKTNSNKGSQTKSSVESPFGTEHLAQSIIGKWELRKSVGGYGGGPTTYPFGNGSILKFADTVFESYQNGQLIESGVYKIHKESNSLNPTLYRLVYVKQSEIFKYFEKLENNQLVISVDADDGYTNYYDRIY